MPRENNQARRSPSVRLLLLNGLLNGASWCLDALPGQMIDGSLALQAGQGDEGLPAVPRAISAILQ